MKHIYLNLKRFDIPPSMGGVNRIAAIEEWADYIVRNTQDAMDAYVTADVEFVDYFPEAHLINAIRARKENSRLQIGCQGVFRADTAPGGNFGAFTTNRPAHAMAALSVRNTIIGHCEERADKAGILAEAGITDPAAVSRILNKEVLAAIESGMSVLYCIGESSEEQARWEEVLGQQLEIGLNGADKNRIVIGYEPIWSIGPGKMPADKDYITKIARFVKESTGGLDVVYGGGLKLENAEMLSTIPEIDGGLIALTRFTGEIGFYPEEYVQIMEKYLGGKL